MKKILGSMLSVVLAIVLAFSSASIALAAEEHTNLQSLQYTSYTENTEDFLNPERGFHPWTVFYDISYYPNTVRDKGYSVAYFPVMLDQYKDRLLDEGFLATLNYQFGQIRAAGIKVVLRFMYDNTGTGEDAPLSFVLQHIEQLKPLLEQNADVIFVMQAGFVGAWGEGHTSVNNLDDPANRNEIYTELLNALPKNRMIEVRTPMYKEGMFGGGPLTEAQAVYGSDQARVGFHNDCFLASESDAGTYGTDPANFAYWKNYVTVESKYTIVSGETCMVNLPRSGGQNALAEMEMQHWSSLSASWNTNVLQLWKDEGYFDEISRRMGYRFSLSQTGLPAQATVGQPFQLEVEMKNSGFARLYNTRQVYLVFDGAEGRYEIPLDSNPWDWEPGTTTAINASFQLPVDMKSGSYKVALWLPDAADSLKNRPEYAIRLANDNVWDAQNGYNVIANALTVVNPAHNTAPVANEAQFATAAGVVANGMLSATDAEGDSLVYEIVQNGQKGTAVVPDASTGAFMYTPAVGMTGSDTFTFRVNDGSSYSNVATVTVMINPIVLQTRTVLSAGEAPAHAGDKVKVTFGLVAAEDVRAMDIRIGYDVATLEFVSAKSVNNGMTLSKVDKKIAGQVRLAMMGQDGALNGDAQLLELVFKVKQEARTAAASISVESAALGNSQGHITQAAPTSLTIPLTLQGDLDGDGTITVGDLALAVTYLGKTKMSPDWDLVKNADLHQNGKINNQDLEAFIRILFD